MNHENTLGAVTASEFVLHASAIAAYVDSSREDDGR